MSDEVRVPIYIANTNPFRLIVRDEDDKWDASLEQINSSTYDYLRLHRASKFFDAEIEKPFPLCVGFDGSFILPAVKKYHSLEATLDEFNRIFASILIGGIYIEGVTPSDLSHGTMTIHGYFRHTKVFGMKGQLHQSLGNCDAGNSQAVFLYEPATISAAEIQTAYRAGASVMKSIPNLSSALFISAFTHFIRRQNREALTATWISIEQSIEHLWLKAVLEEVKGGSIPKRRKFMESQQWTPAHKFELLFQKSVLSLATYESLSFARDARNKFVHRGESPEYSQTSKALSALIDLIEIIAKFEGVGFNREHLDRYMKIQESAVKKEVGRAEDIDWSKVVAWKALKAIPGENDWSGDFEAFEDIALQMLR